MLVPNAVRCNGSQADICAATSYLAGYLIENSGDWTVLSLAAIAEADEQVPIGKDPISLALACYYLPLDPTQ